MNCKQKHLPRSTQKVLGKLVHPALVEVTHSMQAVALKNYDEGHLFLKKSQLVGILERVCLALELTDTQFDMAKSRYEAVGNWLSEGNNPWLRHASIYPQGSISLGTTVRPLGQNEFDVDLVCHLLGSSSASSPLEIKKLIGNRLRENGVWGSMEQKTGLSQRADRSRCKTQDFCDSPSRNVPSPPAVSYKSIAKD